MRATLPLQKTGLKNIRQPLLGVVSSLSPDVHYERVQLPRCNVFWARAPGVPAAPSSGKKPLLVVYVHGGGYISGDYAAFRAFCGKLSRELAAPVMSAEYRLAPEHSIDDSAEDVLAAFLAVADGFERSIVWADSAGGGLTLLFLQVRPYKPPARRPPCAAARWPPGSQPVCRTCWNRPVGNQSHVPAAAGPRPSPPRCAAPALPAGPA